VRVSRNQRICGEEPLLTMAAASSQSITRSYPYRLVTSTLHVRAPFCSAQTRFQNM
jgi:hypothetical protein